MKRKRMDEIKIGGVDLSNINVSDLLSLAKDIVKPGEEKLSGDIPLPGPVKDIVSAISSTKKPAEREFNFLNTVLAIAKDVARDNQIPLSVMLGQTSLETGFGKSIPANNYFGIKGKGTLGSSFLSTQEEGEPGNVEVTKQFFAANEKMQDSFEQYARLITGDSRYEHSETYRNDPGKFLIYVWGKGYATSSNYPKAVSDVSKEVARVLGDSSLEIKFNEDEELLIDYLGSLDPQKRVKETERLMGPGSRHGEFSKTDRDLADKIGNIANTGSEWFSRFLVSFLGPESAEKMGIKVTNPTHDTAQIRQQIGDILTGNDPDARVRIGDTERLGKYLLAWDVAAPIAKSLSGLEVDEDDFVNNPNLQDRVMQTLIDDDYVPAMRRLKDEIPQKASLVSDPKIIALIHFRGEDGARKVLSGAPDPLSTDVGTVDRYLSKVDDDFTATRFQTSSGFGRRINPFTRKGQDHAGVDIPAPEGTPVKASVNGVVTFAGNRSGYGNMVEIDHQDGYSTRYAHLSSISVQAGKKVRAGAKIGEVGETGLATGPHLHFELRRGETPINPSKLLRKRPPV